MYRWFTVAMLAACADTPPLELRDTGEPIPCIDLCDDGFTCTDDHCDTTTGECVHLPRNVTEACRTDAHCDDAIPCTIDRCVVDGCSLQRCQHTPGPGCSACEMVEECPEPTAPCTSRTCRLGFCELAADPLCDLGCAPNAPLEPGESRIRSLVHIGDDCGCDCDMPALVDDLAIISDPPATCRRSCDTDELSCTPVETDFEWELIGVVEGDELHLSRWCTLPTIFRFEERWQGQMRLVGDARVADFSAFSIDGGLGLEDVSCPSCPLLPGHTIVMLLQSNFPYQGMSQVVFQGELRRATIALYPTATGFVGSLHSALDLDPEVVPFDGTITLERVP